MSLVRITTGLLFTRRCQTIWKLFFSRECSQSSSGSDILNEVESLRNDLIPREDRISGQPHQVFVIHPHIRWGEKKRRNTTPQLQLDEAVSLIHTLSGWRVVDKRIVPLMTFDKATFFTKGKLQSLAEAVRGNAVVSSVFVNVQRLKIAQHIQLEEIFNVPVFDRYSIVINIFRHHAKTKEAKLQVALAEIPYIWSRVLGVNDSEDFHMANVGIASGESFKEKRLMLLKQKEQKIKEEIKSLRQNRELLRSKRKRLEIPTVAVVGYTNAGKTSLIKALTQEDKITPEDKLFATLDVTVHAGFLPCRLKVLFVDTIGFISDIPTMLLEPFRATLEDAALADAIVHVQDVTHPDLVAQNDVVLETLKKLDLPESLVDNVITVGNKIDKLNSVGSPSLEGDFIPVSARTGFGLDQLNQKIEEAILRTSRLRKMKIRLKNGSEEYFWLLKNATVSEVDVDEKDSQYVFLKLLITESNLSGFKKLFIEQN